MGATPDHIAAIARELYAETVILLEQSNGVTPERADTVARAVMDAFVEAMEEMEG